MALESAIQSRAWKIAISIAGALAALSLFWVNRGSFVASDGAPGHAMAPELASMLDREVDSVLTLCRIERRWIRKSSVTVPNSRVALIERKVAIPADILPVHVNVAMNAMAKRYNAKVIAYENMKENTVALHIEFNGTIIQKIILKTSTTLRRKESKNVVPQT